MKYAAFLRGINVGGNNTIKMEKLREVLGSVGFDDVKSYINSGNVIFKTAKTSNEKLAAKIAKAVKKDFELDIAIMVRSIPEIEELLANIPFEKGEGQEIFAVFLAEKLSDEKEKLLLAHNNPAETFAVYKTDVFCLMDKGFPDSQLGKKFIDNKLKVAATARNIRTVMKIADLSSSI